MKNTMFKLFISFLLLLLLSCQRKSESTFYEMNIYFLEGSKLNQVQFPPLFPGETSVQFIQKVFENSEDIEHQLNQTIGYQFISLLDAKTFTFQKNETFSEIMKLNPRQLLRVYLMPNGKTNAIPISIALFDLTSEVEVPSNLVSGSELTKFEQQLGTAPFLAVRADVPLDEGIILGRPLPNSDKALFLVLQPILAKKQTEAQLDSPSFGIKKPPTIAELDSNIAPFNSLDKKPALTKKVNPIFPEDARKSGKEGMVILMILIDEKGEVIKTWIKNSSGISSLDEAASVAAKQFEFSPAEVDGKRVKVKMTIPFKFKLNKN
jgi:TonB family protein